MTFLPSMTQPGFDLFPRVWIVGIVFSGEGLVGASVGGGLLIFTD